MSVTTRFRPTACNGPLHLGHLVNAYANLLYAQSRGGGFLVIADAALLYDMLKFPDDATLGQYRANVALLERLFPRRRVVCALVDEWLVLRSLEQRLGERIHKIYDPMLLMAAYDFLFDVDHLIRGRDWDPDSPLAVREQLGSAYTYQLYQERWRGRPLPVSYSPLLLDEQGGKIAKSRKALATTLPHLLAGGVTPLALFAYVVSLIEGRRVTDVAELAGYHRTFSLDKLQARASFAHVPGELAAVGEQVRRAVADAFPGQDPAQAADNLYERLIEGDALPSPE